VISGFSDLLDYYAASCGNFFLTFRDKLSVSLESLNVTYSSLPIEVCYARFRTSAAKQMRTALFGFNTQQVVIGCPETSVRICHYSLRNNQSERSSERRNG